MEDETKLKKDENGLENPIREEKKDKLEIKKTRKSWLVFLIAGILFALSGAGCLLFVFLTPEEEKDELVFPEIPSKTISETEVVYSSLTGLPLADAGQKNAPAYCIQIPNGLDGARPQVGLTEAGVIFEAIAEAGITRFATIFQNPSTAVIGPIRSLRIYYLDWDTPFDCTIVHAGGAYNALEAVRVGGYKDLTENYTYMYRGSAYGRLWNNLFTTSASLARFSADHGFNTSDIKGFGRLTPEESTKNRIDIQADNRLNITERTEANTSALSAKVSEINLNFGGMASFNVHYSYDLNTNTYLRSFRNGEPHQVYRCADGDLGNLNPEGNCDLVQMAPAVVIAMVVDERRAPDGYYESIATTGTGNVYIFQNGTVIKGTWEKPSRADQIRFFDENKNEVMLAPGQAFVSAVPGYGGVEF